MEPTSTQENTETPLDMNNPEAVLFGEDVVDGNSETPPAGQEETPPSEVPDDGSEAPGSTEGEPKPEDGETPPEGSETPPAEPSSGGNDDPSNNNAELSQEQKDAIVVEMTDGKFKTAAEYAEANVVEKLGSYDALVAERDQLKEASEKDPFTNDFAKQLNDFMAVNGTEGLDAYLKVQSFDTEKGFDLDAVKLKMQVEHPELKDDQINRRLAKDYKIGGDHAKDNIDKLLASEDEDEIKRGQQLQRDVEDARTDLLMDGKKAKTFIDEKKADMTVETPDEATAKADQAETERMAQWKPELEEQVAKFEALEFEVDGAKDEYNKFRYEIPAEHREELKQHLPEIVKLNGLEFNDEGKAAAEEILHNLYFSWNREDVMKAYGNHIKSMSEEQWAAAVHNPSAAKSKEETPPAPPKSQEASAIDEILAFESVPLSG